MTVRTFFHGVFAAVALASVAHAAAVPQDPATAATSSSFSSSSAPPATTTTAVDETVGSDLQQADVADVADAPSDDDDDDHMITDPPPDGLAPEITDYKFWCTSLDDSNAEAVQTLWEQGYCDADGNCGIGAPTWLLNNWTQNEDSRDNWPFNLASHYAPYAADLKIGECGKVGASNCDPSPGCGDLVDIGHADVFWILRALAQLQSQINIANEYLQSEAISKTLHLSDIAADFSAPAAFNSMALLAGIISSSFFIIGGVAGLASISANLLRSNAASAMGRANAAKAAAGTDTAAIANADKLIANAQKFDDTLANVGKSAGAASGGTYLVGSIFGMISVTKKAKDQVTTGQLDNVLDELFTNARDYLETIGRLATGQAEEGEDYNLLPHNDGVGPADLTSPIAGFFADGKYLLNSWKSDFNASLNAAFGQFETKIVDQAMITGGLQIVSPDMYDTEEKCLDPEMPYAGYGSRWLDMGDGNSFCMQVFRKSSGNDADPPTVAEPEITDKLVDKYGINLEEWYKAAYNCSKYGPEDRVVDVYDVPTDGSLPLCWFAIEAIRMSVHGRCISGGCHETDYYATKYSFRDDVDAPSTDPPTEPTGTKQNNVGCYSKGFRIEDLHGFGNPWSVQEVYNDAGDRCNAAAGTVLKAGEFWWDCTEWPAPDGNTFAHIWWEIQPNNNDEVTITKDICFEDWKKEIDGCTAGSEQSDYHDFWFRFDPNEGPCPFKKE